MLRMLILIKYILYLFDDFPNVYYDCIVLIFFIQPTDSNLFLL